MIAKNVVFFFCSRFMVANLTIPLFCESVQSTKTLCIASNYRFFKIKSGPWGPALPSLSQDSGKALAKYNSEIFERKKWQLPITLFFSRGEQSLAQNRLGLDEVGTERKLYVCPFSRIVKHIRNIFLKGIVLRTFFFFKHAW